MPCGTFRPNRLSVPGGSSPAARRSSGTALGAAGFVASTRTSAARFLQPAARGIASAINAAVDRRCVTPLLLEERTPGVHASGAGWRLQLDGGHVHLHAG